jgi:transposase-like protein
MLDRKKAYSSGQKIAAVSDYLNQRKSLRVTARRHGVSRSTLWFWIQRHAELGPEGLQNKQARIPPIPSDHDLQIMRLKEKHPGLSLRKARIKLNGRTSLYAIRRVWKEYGLMKNKQEDPLDRFIPETPGLTFALNTVLQKIEKNDFRQAARILNRLPVMPRSAALNRIPTKYLSPRRRLDLLCLYRQAGSYKQLAYLARRLSDLLARNDFQYSSIIADFYELDALDIIGQPGKKAAALEKLAGKMVGIKSYPLRFLFCFESAFTSVYLLQINRAFKFIDECRKYVYLLPHPHYWELFGSLLVLIGKFKNARGFYEKARSETSDPQRLERLSLQVARYAHCYPGDYQTCRRMLAQLKTQDPLLTHSSAFNLTHAYLNFGEGDLIEARRYFIGSLETAARGQHTNRIYAASVGLAGVAQALGQAKEARSYLKKYLPLIKKNRMFREALLLECFIDPDRFPPAELTRMSPFKLISLLRQAHRTKKVTDYRRALNFADSCGLGGLLHRWIVFFPDSVKHLLEIGRKTGLPNSILNYPIFNQKIPVYHLKILGDLTVAKDGRRLKARFTPKERSLLIHLALRAGAPGKSIEMGILGRNFWPHKSNVTPLLSHRLVKMKKKLHLPGHLLTISTRSDSSRLINRGIYLTTDYAELKSLLAQAQILELSGEWHFARREYMRAFALCRGEPFKKIYDDWSEDIRNEIRNYLEREAVRFARICLDRNDRKGADMALGKAVRVIPGSPVISEILNP